MQKQNEDPEVLNDQAEEVELDFDRMEDYIEKYDIANSTQYQHQTAELLAMPLPKNISISTKSRTYDEIFNEWYKMMPDISLGDMKMEVIRILESSQGGSFMPNKNRILLNLYLVELAKRTLATEVQDMVPRIKNSYENLSKMEDATNRRILNTCDIIAMTTTGAAKFKTMLSTVKSEVLVVEEAAQILEAHLITSLNPHTKQLILIGDHQQLRPSVNNMEMQTNYNLDISLFERLINNGFQNEMLLIQRRMRPEISEVVRKIYPKVTDHASVLTKPNVRGLGQENYFFFNHDFPEEMMKNVLSKTN